MVSSRQNVVSQLTVQDEWRDLYGYCVPTYDIIGVMVRTDCEHGLQISLHDYRSYVSLLSLIVYIDGVYVLRCVTPGV